MVVSAGRMKTPLRNTLQSGSEIQHDSRIEVLVQAEQDFYREKWQKE
jgi:hypothetical protein